MCGLNLLEWWTLDVKTQHRLIQIYEVEYEVKLALKQAAGLGKEA